MPTRLLIIGDMHLGRVPGRLEASGVDPRRLSPAVAWQSTIDAAIANSVDAVLLAGDVVDDDRDQFEAYGHLERGVGRLTENDIAVYGVAGNHDGIVLPRLAARLAQFHLLGAGPRWQLAQLPGETPVDLLGWSFAERHHRANPLDSPGLNEALAARRAGVACLGLLHCDLDVSGGGYGPVSRAALAELGLDGWFLGHIHMPGELDPQRPLGYLGSLVGLDRGEADIHGPLLVEVAGPGRLSFERQVLGPVVWLNLAVSAADLPDDDGAADALHGRIEARFRQAAVADPRLSRPGVRVVACSVRLTDPTQARERVRRFVADTAADDLVFAVGEQQWAVAKLIDDTRPAVDLHALAVEPTPVGVVARLLLELQGGGQPPEEVSALAQKAAAPFAVGKWRVHDERYPPADPDHDLQVAARRLLDALLAQRPTAGGA